MEQVILVDSSDRELGAMEKLRAHQEGKLHRAFSVFIFNSKGEMLLQRRAVGKYHSGGLWTNACCGHPRPGEPVQEAAKRRLAEETGLDVPLEVLFPFVYLCPVGNDLYEYEYDHVLIGQTDTEPNPDPGEILEHKWASPADIAADLDINSRNYTIWFQLIFKDVAARTAK